MKAATLVFLLLVLAPGCTPECKLDPVSLPAAEAQVGWLEPARPRIPVDLAGLSRTALLDTAWPHSAIDLSSAPGVSFDTAQVAFGGATAGPLHWEPALEKPGGADMVLGADVLVQMPLVLDARAAATRVLPAFQESGGVAPLTRWSSGLCRGDRAESGPEGPELLLVNAELEGRPLTLAIDTGADVTLVRQSAVPDLASRPILAGIPLRTGFGGTFTVIATRARSLSVGGQSSASTPVLVHPAIDAELDRVLRDYRGASTPLDGFLGWSFLREFEVSLALGSGPGAGRALGLTRFDTQAHARRHFTGVGMATSPWNEPVGLLVVSLFSVSPAREAGIDLGDVITAVNGAPAREAPLPWGAPGEVVQLSWFRDSNGQTFTADVQVEDLLPDPAP